MPRHHEDNERYRSFTRRALFIGGGQAALFAVLAGRMYYLQVIEAERYATLAEDNRINLRLLPPPRGRIVDRFGVPLAVNQQNYRVVLVREQARDVKRTLESLAKVIRLPEEEFERILRDAKHKRAFVPVSVRDYLSWDEVSRIEVNAPDLPGVNIEVGQTRNYPFGESMTHVLGYVSSVNQREQTGGIYASRPATRCSNCPAFGSASRARRSNTICSFAVPPGPATWKSTHWAESFARSGARRASRGAIWY
jgi:penicillin-binding protein 2